VDRKGLGVPGHLAIRGTDRIIPLRRPYNERVARGWESKSVESQQEDVRSAAEPKDRLTPQQRDVESRRQALRLSRSLTLQRLHASENSRYRAVLEQALAELDRQLSEFD